MMRPTIARTLYNELCFLLERPICSSNLDHQHTTSVTMDWKEWKEGNLYLQ